MSRLSARIKLGGRKYAVVLYTLELGFALGLTGLLVATLEPEIAQYVAAIVGSFGLLGSASIVAYNGANAAQDWHTTPGKPPAPRQSGMIQEPIDA
jgi:hypothetical protein